MVPIRSHMDCKRVQESKLSFKWWNQKQRHTKICRLFIKRGTWHFNSGQFVAKYINVKRSWMCVSYRQSTPTEICQNEDRWRRRVFFLPDRATTLNANSIFECQIYWGILFHSIRWEGEILIRSDWLLSLRSQAFQTPIDSKSKKVKLA